MIQNNAITIITLTHIIKARFYRGLTMKIPTKNFPACLWLKSCYYPQFKLSIQLWLGFKYFYKLYKTFHTKLHFTRLKTSQIGYCISPEIFSDNFWNKFLLSFLRYICSIQHPLYLTHDYLLHIGVLSHYEKMKMTLTSIILFYI